MKTPLHVLIIEDSEDDALLLVRALRSGGYDPTFERVDTPAAVTAALNQQTWDIIISDYSMPYFSGLAALELLKESGLDIPFIILSGAIGEETAVETMRAGAHDYIMKGNLTRLIPAIERELREAAVRREGKRAEEEAKELQAQLLQSEKMAAVGQLVSGVAHELNNPLAGIIIRAQLLLRRDLDSKSRQGIETILEQGRRAGKIIENLLTFARQQAFSKRPLRLSVVITKTLDLRAYEMRVNNIEVITDFDPKLPLVLADFQQMQQVFLNIIINAEQAMLEANNGGTLTITTENLIDSVKISFSDDGPGIPEENLRTIFNPFFTTKDVGKGTGLGLSICYGIIQEHNGKMYAQSKEGEGAEFIIELPMHTGEQKVYKEQETKVSLRKTASKSILIVEDEPSIQGIFFEVLADEGHQVDTADNGEVAWAKIQRGKYDLIIADIKMPKLDGRQLYEYVRRNNSELAKKIIFVTGDIASTDTRSFLEATENPYLTKPFELKETMKVIQTMLEGN